MAAGSPVQLPHYADRQPSLPPAVSLFILPSSLPSLLTLCSLYRVAADMRGKQAERSLSLSLSLSFSLSRSLSLPVSCSVTRSFIQAFLTREVLGGEALPCDGFVTLCQPVECHWENITSANVALCDTASEVKKSATCERLQGKQPHGHMSEKALSETRVKVRGGGEWALCLCVGWGWGWGGAWLCLGTWHKWSLQPLGCFCGSGANCSVTGGNTCLSLAKDH